MVWGVFKAIKGAFNGACSGPHFIVDTYAEDLSKWGLDGVAGLPGTPGTSKAPAGSSSATGGSCWGRPLALSPHPAEASSTGAAPSNSSCAVGHGAVRSQTGSEGHLAEMFRESMLPRSTQQQEEKEEVGDVTPKRPSRAPTPVSGRASPCHRAPVGQEEEGGPLRAGAAAEEGDAEDDKDPRSHRRAPSPACVLHEEVPGCSTGMPASPGLQAARCVAQAEVMSHVLPCGSSSSGSGGSKYAAQNMDACQEVSCGEGALPSATCGAYSCNPAGNAPTTRVATPVDTSTCSGSLVQASPAVDDLVRHLLQQFEAASTRDAAAAAREAAARAREGEMMQEMRQLREQLATVTAAMGSNSVAAAAASTAHEQQLQLEVTRLSAVVARHEQRYQQLSQQVTEAAAGIVSLRQEMGEAADDVEEQLQQLQEDASSIEDWVEQVQQGGLLLLQEVEQLQVGLAHKAEQAAHAASWLCGEAARWKSKFEKVAAHCSALQTEVAAAQQALRDQQQAAVEAILQTEAEAQQQLQQQRAAARQQQRQQQREAEVRFDKYVGSFASIVNQMAASDRPGLGVRFVPTRNATTGRVATKGSGANGAVLYGQVYYKVHPTDPTTCALPQEASVRAVAKVFDPDKPTEVVMALKAGAAGGMAFWGVFEVEGKWRAVYQDEGCSMTALFKTYPTYPFNPYNRAHLGQRATLSSQVVSKVDTHHAEVGAHLDIKAENLVVTSRKSAIHGGAEVKVIDFDLTATALALATRQWKLDEAGNPYVVPMNCGTLQYMPATLMLKRLNQEQLAAVQQGAFPGLPQWVVDLVHTARDPLTPVQAQAADIYAVCCVVWELLTGWRVFWLPGWQMQPADHVPAEMVEQMQGEVYFGDAWTSMSVEGSMALLDDQLAGVSSVLRPAAEQATQALLELVVAGLRGQGTGVTLAQLRAAAEALAAAAGGAPPPAAEQLGGAAAAAGVPPPPPQQQQQQEDMACAGWLLEEANEDWAAAPVGDTGGWPMTAVDEDWAAAPAGAELGGA